MRLITLVLLFALSVPATAQLANLADNRVHTVDARVRADQFEADSAVLTELPPMHAIVRVMLVPEDSSGNLWMLSASFTIATQYTELLTWTSETVAAGECQGCLAADWPLTYGNLLYRKESQRIVVRLGGWTGDLRGSMRVIIQYIDLS